MPAADKVYMIGDRLILFDVSCCEVDPDDHYMLKITYGKNKTTRSFVRNDVSILPVTSSSDAGYVMYDEAGNSRFVCRIHTYGGGLVYGYESNKGFVLYKRPGMMSVREYPVSAYPSSVIQYLKEISELCTFEDKDGKVHSLRNRYDKLNYIYTDRMLHAYCHPETFTNTCKAADFLIFPFGCNESQFEAVRNAVTSRMSVIQGPPGTGKTQTILNIIANLLVNGKTCLVVSNNNDAVDNVFDKLDEYGLGFLVARLGTHKTEFLNNQTPWPDISAWKCALDRLKPKISEISRNMNGYFRDCHDEALCRERKSEMERQFEMADVSHEDMSFKSLFMRGDIRSLYRILLDYDHDVKVSGKVRFWTRLKALLHGVLTDDRNIFERMIQTREYNELKRRLPVLQKRISSFNKAYRNLRQMSSDYLKGALASRIKGGVRRIFTDKSDDSDVQDSSIWGNSKQFLECYPIVTSSVFSASGLINPAVAFDYLIIDEASQAGIAGGALALNCARNVVIVGDEKQLPNIVTPDVEQKATSIFRRYDLNGAYDYSRNSFLGSVISLFPQAPSRVLYEHYRCDPLIIGFCNRKFYGGNLVVMTERKDDSPVVVCPTVKGNHRRHFHNMREAETVIEIVRSLRKQYDDIGVIVPFNEQAARIQALLNGDEGLNDMKISTVHSFQGKENDVIIFSTVVNEVDDFVDDGNFLNVAISRARRKFVLVVTGNELAPSNIKDLVDYIAYNGGYNDHGQLHSVFDLLYSQYALERRAFLERFSDDRRYQEIPYTSEKLALALLDEIVSMERFNSLGVLFQYPLSKIVSDDIVLTPEERKYAFNCWTLVDFVLYNKVSKQAVLAIEIDGTAFHDDPMNKDDETAFDKDEAKVRICESSGVRCIRLRTEGSRERERIVRELDDILGYEKKH